MSLIDIRKLNAELDKMISQQNEEIKLMNEQIAESKSAKWKAFAMDMKELQTVVDEMNVDIYVPFVTINNRDYGFKFSRFSSIAAEWSNRLCIATRIHTSRNYLGWKDRDYAIYYEAFMNVWPKVKDEFMNRFEEQCVIALREKAVKANEKYEKKLKEVSEL